VDIGFRKKIMLKELVRRPWRQRNVPRAKTSCGQGRLDLITAAEKPHESHVNYMPGCHPPGNSGVIKSVARVSHQSPCVRRVPSIGRPRRMTRHRGMRAAPSPGAATCLHLLVEVERPHPPVELQRRSPTGGAAASRVTRVTRGCINKDWFSCVGFGTDNCGRQL
jgi:hypothetical protein